MPTYTGTGAQTLSIITQSATGQQLLNALEHHTAQVAGAPFAFVEDSLTETAYGSSSLQGISTVTLQSTVNAGNTITFDVITNLHETAVCSDQLRADETTLLAPPSPKFKSSIVQSIEYSLTSTVNLSNTIETIVTTSLTGSATVGDVLTPDVQANQLLVSTVQCSSSFPAIGLEETLTSTANLSNVLTPYAVVTENLTGAANVSDLQTWWASVTESLVSAVNVNEIISFEGSIANETLTSTAQVSDWLWAKDFEAIAWVMNTQSGGLTSYNNFGFDSIAFHSGKLYATSPDGLFELDADTDDGRNIQAVAKGGFLDFGMEEKKRLSDVYIGYTAGGDLECDIEVYDGPDYRKEVYTYEMEPRDADAPRNNRLKPGRGLSSRFWRFAFRNIDGADFQIHDIAVQVAKSKRRL